MTTTSQGVNRNPWAWIPTLYLYQGIPYSIVMTTSGLIYKTMGISVAALAFWTSLLYLPWAIKPLWSPYVEVVSTKRNWIIITQLLLGFSFIVAGSVMPLTFFFPLTVALFAFVAISSASHDIAADGFYMHALDQHKQAFFVGIRSTFYRIAMLTAMGALPLIAGLIQEKTGLPPVTLQVKAVPADQYLPDVAPEPAAAVSGRSAGIFLYPGEVRVPIFQKGISEIDTALAWISLSAPPSPGEKIVLNLTHKSGSRDLKLAKNQSGRFEFTEANWNKPVIVVFTVDHNLERSASAVYRITAGNIAFSWTVSLGILGVFLLLLGLYHKFMLPYPREAKAAESVNLRVYGDVFVSFFRKPGIIAALLFFLLYRFGESQSIKIATPFLVDSRASGGIGLTSAQYGIAYGTIGMLALTVGGILGGLCAAKYGLRKLIWLMALSMNLPNLGLLYIAYTQPLPGDIAVYGAIILEQFGYGFGFTAYMLYMLYFVGDSKYKTAEYAIGTSLMALGMMLPGMMSGYVEEWLGYQHFFVYVMLCTLPGMLIIPFLKIDPAFGIKKVKNEK
jgi:MFS transporter, PAT family, beta-lactamase induction signal transducer AmpG